MLFEAGALSRDADAIVVPYLIGFEPSQIKAEPLTMFQATTASKTGTFDLVRAINRSDPDNALSDSALNFAFRRHWPVFQTSLQNAKRQPKEAIAPPDPEEVLGSVRELLSRLSSLSDPMGIDSPDVNRSRASASVQDHTTTAERLAAIERNGAIPTAEQLAAFVESNIDSTALGASGIDPKHTPPAMQMDAEPENVHEDSGGSSAARCSRVPSALSTLRWWPMAA